ncbi:putative SP-containing protein [Vairimorpha necatrix]|uniref:SP-containing protein n=1 Tax=Vairimorpha necatrix TaxID=6039 RepID=A0AAX4JG89_9MICR
MLLTLGFMFCTQLNHILSKNDNSELNITLSYDEPKKTVFDLKGSSFGDFTQLLKQSDYLGREYGIYFYDDNLCDNNFNQTNLDQISNNIHSKLQNNNYQSGIVNEETEYSQEFFSIKIFNKFEKSYKILSECRNNIDQYILLIKNTIIEKKYTNNQILKDSEDYRKFQINSIKIHRFSQFLKRIKNIQLPRTSGKLKTLNLPLETNNIISAFIDLFVHFTKIFFTRERHITSKSYSAVTKQAMFNYNKEILSAFDHIPIVKILEIIDEELNKFKYESYSQKIKVRRIIELLNNKINVTFVKTKKCIEIYNQVSQIYNK